MPCRGRRLSEPSTTDFASQLAEGRAQIDRIDQSIVALIAERVRTGESLAAIKRAAGLAVLDPEREARVVRRAAELARSAGLPEEAIRDLYWRLIGLTRMVEHDGQ